MRTTATLWLLLFCCLHWAYAQYSKLEVDSFDLRNVSDSTFLSILLSKESECMFIDSTFKRQLHDRVVLDYANLLIQGDDNKAIAYLKNLDKTISFWNGNDLVHYTLLYVMCHSVQHALPLNYKRDYCAECKEANTLLLQELLLARGYFLKKLLFNDDMSCFDLRPVLYEGCLNWSYFARTETKYSKEYGRLYTLFAKKVSECFGDQKEILSAYYLTPYVYHLFPEGSFD